MRHYRRYYRLEGKKLVECRDVIEWATYFETKNTNRRIAEEMVGNSYISTVFLGIDHQFGNGPPLLFETMVFGGLLDQEQDRCSTLKEAVAMHAAMVLRVRREDIRWRRWLKFFMDLF